jgi:hypothetical protein
MQSQHSVYVCFRAVCMLMCLYACFSEVVYMLPCSVHASMQCACLHAVCMLLVSVQTSMHSIKWAHLNCRLLSTATHNSQNKIKWFLLYTNFHAASMHCELFNAVCMNPVGMQSAASTGDCFVTDIYYSNKISWYILCIHVFMCCTCINLRFFSGNINWGGMALYN